MKNGVIGLTIIVLTFVMIGFVSAGVGIKWTQESFIVAEDEKACLTYSVYNPWPEESYVRIELPENLKELLVSQEAETKFVPSNTASVDAIPISFCFKSPKVYAEECIIGGFLCKKECKEEQKVYTGEISVKSVPGNTEMSGSGGSATQMSVSAPLRLKITCTPHSTDFSLIYIILAIIALIAIVIILYRRYRKPEKERKKEELERLNRKIKKLKEKK